MLATPLLHKPISYGSDFLDWLFVGVISLHAAMALCALISGLFALSVLKGGRRHLRYGKFFVRSITWTAVTGILLDIVRLSYCIEENHSKYFNYAMPSSYPARFAFLFAGVCVFHLIRQGGPRVVLSGIDPGFSGSGRWITALLVVVGVGLSALIYLSYNPWTGALWMVWTFLASLFCVALIAKSKKFAGRPERKSTMHRFCMLFLISFCGWGAMQGFGPAIVLALGGVDNTTAVYTGNQPGGYDPAFWWFLLSWAPFFLMGAYLFRRFSRPHGRSSPN